MKRIEPPNILGPESETASARHSPWLNHRISLSDVLHADFYSRSKRFTAPRLWIAVLLVLGLVAFEHRAAALVATALSTVLTGLFFFAKHLADQIQITREIPPQATEGETLTFKYTLKNEGHWALRIALLKDSFSGTSQHEIEISLQGSLAAKSFSRVEQKVPLDAGMGTHRAGPILCWITDPLNVFRFRIFFEEIAEVEIYPQPLVLPEVSVNGSPFSQHFGNHEASIKGASTNFVGVREYEPGDSLRQICWKISSRRPGGLLVKEFEKTVNSEITFLLNLNTSEHSGEKSHSTWEACKDLVLSLASQHVSNGNSVQIITTEDQTGFGRGREHSHLLMRWLYPKAPHPDTNLYGWILRSLEFIPPRSTVFLVSPVLSKASALLFEASSPLFNKDIHVTAFLAQSASYVRYQGDPWVMESIQGSKDSCQTNLLQLTREFHRVGARVFHLTGDKNLKTSLLREAPL